MGSQIGLPPGYKLDEPTADTGLPPGYKLDEAPAKEPTTAEDFIKLADSLPKGSKEREDAINMAVRLKEPGAAGNAVALTAAIPAVANPLALARSLGASYAGSWVGKHVGGWVGHPEAGRIIGGFAGALDPTTVPATAKMIPFGVGRKLAPVFEKLFGAEPGMITNLAQRMFGKKTGELTQSEMVAIVKNLSRGGEGDVVNPSVETVAASMKPPVPAGVDAETMAALQKWGMSAEDAARLATRAVPKTPAAAATGPKVLPMPSRVLSAPSPSTSTPEQIALRLQQLTGGKITPDMEAYLAAQPEAEAAAIRAVLSRGVSKMPPTPAIGPAAPGPAATAPGDLEAVLQASIKAAERRRAAQLALEAQGEGVTHP